MEFFILIDHKSNKKIRLTMELLVKNLAAHSASSIFEWSTINL
jgi:hypothetical protein